MYDKKKARGLVVKVAKEQLQQESVVGSSSKNDEVCKKFPNEPAEICLHFF